MKVHHVTSLSKKYSICIYIYIDDIIYIYIGWVVPPPSNSDRQDYYILVGNPYKPSFPLLLGRGRGTTQYIGMYATKHDFPVIFLVCSISFRPCLGARKFSRNASCWRLMLLINCPVVFEVDVFFVEYRELEFGI